MTGISCLRNQFPSADCIDLAQFSDYLLANSKRLLISSQFTVFHQAAR